MHGYDYNGENKIKTKSQLLIINGDKCHNVGCNQS